MCPLACGIFHRKVNARIVSLSYPKDKIVTNENEFQKSTCMVYFVQVVSDKLGVGQVSKEFLQHRRIYVRISFNRISTYSVQWLSIQFNSI